MMGKGRAPCCDKARVKKGPWTPAEDLRLIAFIQKNGHDNWRSLPKLAGLARCGKSCRLRWINYLRPDVKRGNFTPDEEDAIISLHQSMGNKWSRIASYFPGRTDNEIKNIWNTHLKKRASVKGKLKMDQALLEQNINTSANSNVVVYNKTTSSEEQLDKPLLPNVEVDFEFWSMLDMDSLASFFQTTDDIVVQDKVVDHSLSFYGEQNKWLHQLETDLGLLDEQDDLSGIIIT